VESEFGGKESNWSGQSWEVYSGACGAGLQVVVLAFSSQLQMSDCFRCGRDRGGGLVASSSEHSASHGHRGFEPVAAADFRLLFSIGGQGSKARMCASGVRSKKTCRFRQVAKSCVELVWRGSGQLHVLALQAAGLGTGRSLAVVSFFQFAMSFCHDDSIQKICAPATGPPGWDQDF